jgi:phosphoribosyl 1,2-cyclic phosphate phosphodiesterase
MISETVTILGCGSSGGVPRIGNDWGVCDPQEPRNRRTRCGIHISAKQSGTEFRLLIDTAPELREQLIRNEISDIDAVLFTHTHADQCHGIDDLRVLAYYKKAQMPVYGSHTTIEELLERFRYCFKQPDRSPYPPIMKAMPAIIPGVNFTIQKNDTNLQILPLDQDHGSVRSLAFRIGDIAYCNDVVDIPETSLMHLEGLDVFIVDALRYAPHPTHAHLEKSLEWVERLKPKRAILTNLHIDMDYEALSKNTPDNVFAAYDGMVINS